MSQKTVIALRIGLILAVTGVGYAWLAWKGPTPVYRGAEPTSEIVPFWYMLSAFPALGMLVADWAELWAGKHRAACLELGAQIGLLVAISALRLDTHFPLSGHMLLLACFLGRRWLLKAPAQSLRLLENLVGVLLLAAVSYMKLGVWSDVMSWGTGLLGGAGLAVLSWLAWRQWNWKASPGG